MQDMAYQGAVFGPPLWNCYYADTCMATRSCNFDEVVFADDLNAWRALPGAVSEADAYAEIRSCQASLHEWG
eukprot:5101622-Pyramimonas_sp.AAC.1